MIDTWKVNINSATISLGTFELKPNPIELKKYQIYKPDCLHYFNVVPGHYLFSGVAIEAIVYKNGNPYGKIQYSVADSVIAGQFEDRILVLFPSQLLVDKYDSEPETRKSVPVCTCGVKFTGGICSDWCDLAR